MSDYYTESQVKRIEQDAHDGAMLEAGKEWERQRYEFGATEAELQSRITELEAAQARWVMVSERLPKVSGWYFVGLTAYWGNCPTDVVYFDAENIEHRWNMSLSDVIYCWLDGIPVLPKLPEVKK